MVNLIEGLKMINEGKTLKDKFLISEYLFFKVPIHFVMRKLGFKKVNNNLIGEVVLKNGYGIFFCGRNIFSVATCSSGYEEAITGEIRKFDGGVFIDIGANVGRYSIILGNLLKDKIRIIAIEPLEGNIRIIKKSIDLNNLDNIILLQTALGSKSKVMDFYIDPTGAGGGSSSLIKPQKESIKIPVKKLDNIAKELRLTRVDLIKIDVEGAEADVLKGGINTLKKFHPKIIFEAWNEDYLSKIRKILEPLNYKIEKIAEENYLATKI